MKTAEVLAVTTRGGSMRPLINAGNVVYARAVAPSSLKAGDIVLYELDGEKFIHRIWGRTPSGFLIGDDAGIVAPYTIPVEAVIGRTINGPHGFPGLLFGRSVNLLFRFLRSLKVHLSRP